MVSSTNSSRDVESGPEVHGAKRMKEKYHSPFLEKKFKELDVVD